MQKAILRKDALTETYKDVKALIKNIVWKFFKIHGGSFEELEAEANYAFIKAYDKHDSNRSEFTTYLYHSVWNSLLNFRYNDPTFKKIKNQVDEILSIIPIKQNDFYVIDLIDEFKNDTKTILNLVFDIPKDFQSLMEKKHTTKDGKQIKKMENCVYDYLRNNIKWKRSKIKKAFEEITEIINPNNKIAEII